MTLTATTLSLGAWLCSMQAPEPDPGLQARPQAALRALQPAARAWIAANSNYDRSGSPAERRTAQQARGTALAEFDAALQAFETETGRTLLLDAAALATAFADVFVPLTTPGSVGGITLSGEAEARRAEFVPRGYDPERAYPTVLLLSGREQRGDEEALRRYVELTWGEAAERESMLVIAPLLPPDLDLDGPSVGVDPQPSVNESPVADPSAQQIAEQRRLGTALRPLGEAWQHLHAARDRVVLDCGRGASAFGLRLVSMFPDRFAGLVLRWPQADPALRIEGLRGLPVLLVRCAETADACEALYAALHAQAPGSCRVLTPPGGYPFAAENGIAEWARQQRRDPMARTVVLAPSHDRFQSNRWVRIETAEPVGGPPWTEAPRLVADADPQQNRITVMTRGVQSFRLLLGPALVDVRDFTLVVNGKEEQVHLVPSLKFLVENMTQRFDPGHLVTAQHRVVLP